MNFPRRPIRSATEGVRVVNLDHIAPGEFGKVRTRQLDPSLPLQPASSDELKAMIASRNAVLKSPGGYANLPVRLTPQQQVNLTAKLGDDVGEMTTKFYTTPDGGQGMSFKKPWVDRPASPSPDEIGQAAFKTAYGEMPILLNHNQGEVMMPNDYPQHELQGRDMKQSDMMSVRQMLGSLNASNAAERIELTDRLQRGGFNVSTSNQMAELNPEIQGGTWTGADIAQLDAIGAAGTLQRVDSEDALFPTWKQTPSQSAQMQQADILRGQQGATDVRDLARPMNPLYTVNRPGMKIANTEHLSAAPSRTIPFQQKTWEMVNADGSVTPIYKTVRGNSEVADALTQRGLARPIEQVPLAAPGEIYSTDRETVNVPPAFQAPEPLPTKGGYDMTTDVTDRDYSLDTWGDVNRQVMLPSTVLADKGLSPYFLSQNSQIPIKELGRQRYSGDSYNDRMEGDQMIDTSPNTDYVKDVEREKGKWDYYEPMQDSRSVLDRLGQSQRRANTGYVSDRNRMQTRYPNERIQGDVAGRAVLRDLPADDQAILGDALRGGMGQTFKDMTSYNPPSNAPKPTEEMLSQLVNRYAPVREYDRRVQLAKNAIDEGHRSLGTLPDVEPTRITTMVPNGTGYDQMVETADMPVAQRLAEARDFQSRGYGQATMGLPEGVTVEAENVNSHLVFPVSEKTVYNSARNRAAKQNKVPAPLISAAATLDNALGDEQLSPELASRILAARQGMGSLQGIDRVAQIQMSRDTGGQAFGEEAKRKKFIVGTDGIQRVETNGSLQQVYPLDNLQRAQFQAEIAAGQRQVMPMGATQPGISMSNELMKDGEPLGRAANLPVSRRNANTEDEGIYATNTDPFVQQRFAADENEQRMSAGKRLRGEMILPVADDPVSQTEREIVQYAANQRQRRVEPVRRPVADPKMGAFDLTPSPIMRASDSDLEAIQAEIIAAHANGQYRGLKPLPGWEFNPR